MAQAKLKYSYATGRRKTAAARVFLYPLDGGAESERVDNITVNGKTLSDYFPANSGQHAVKEPLAISEREDRYGCRVTVRGGGSNGQAEAIRHGIARAIEALEPELRPVLKQAGFLTRDPRKVERKKPGRHKARKKPQFSKR